MKAIKLKSILVIVEMKTKKKQISFNLPIVGSKDNSRVVLICNKNYTTKPHAYLNANECIEIGGTDSLNVAFLEKDFEVFKTNDKYISVDNAFIYQLSTEGFKLEKEELELFAVDFEPKI